MALMRASQSVEVPRLRAVKRRERRAPMHHERFELLLDERLGLLALIRLGPYGAERDPGDVAVCSAEPAGARDATAFPVLLQSD